MITERVVKFLLERSLGRFLKSRINLNQLHVELGAGRVSLSQIELDEEPLNEILESAGIGIQIRRVELGKLRLRIPWNDILSDNSKFELEDVEIEISPKEITPHHSHSNESFDMQSTLMYSLLNESTVEDDDQVLLNLVGDDLKLISRLIQRLLLRMEVEVKRLSVTFKSIDRNSEKAKFRFHVDAVRYADPAHSHHVSRTQHSARTA
jgi:hypothetical protein